MCVLTPYCVGQMLSQCPSYENMVQLPILDDILYNLQRQGRIVFYVCRAPFHQSVCSH